MLSFEDAQGQTAPSKINCFMKDMRYPCKKVGKMNHLFHFEAMKIEMQRNSRNERIVGWKNIPDIGRALHNTVKKVKLVFNNSQLPLYLSTAFYEHRTLLALYLL